MTLLIWLLYGGSIYVLLAVGYRVFISVRALRVELSKTKVALQGFGPDEFRIEPAQPSRADDLPKLLLQLRARERAKAHAADERRRRLVNRISSIDIDKRSA